MMKSTMLHRNDTDTNLTNEDMTRKPQRRRHDLMIGKALAIISVFVLAAVAIELFYNSAVERIEAERSVWYPPYYVPTAYTADFWKMLIMHTR